MIRSLVIGVVRTVIALAVLAYYPPVGLLLLILWLRDTPKKPAKVSHVILATYPGPDIAPAAGAVSSGPLEGKDWRTSEAYVAPVN